MCVIFICMMGLCLTLRFDGKEVEWVSIFEVNNNRRRRTAFKHIYICTYVILFIIELYIYIYVPHIRYKNCVF